jgi:putative transcriptional regulator
LSAVARGEGPEPMVVALGYAGWDRGQLEAELLANAWLTVAAEPALIFETPFEQRWAAAVALLGVDVHQITSYAGHA